MPTITARKTGRTTRHYVWSGDAMIGAFGSRKAAEAFLAQHQATGRAEALASRYHRYEAAAFRRCDAQAAVILSGLHRGFHAGEGPNLPTVKSRRDAAARALRSARAVHTPAAPKAATKDPRQMDLFAVATDSIHRDGRYEVIRQAAPQGAFYVLCDRVADRCLGSFDRIADVATRLADLIRSEGRTATLIPIEA